MKAKLLYISVMAIGAAAVFAVAFYFWQAWLVQPRTIVSDDGLASLVLSRDALPRGVSLRDVSITSLAPEAYPNTVAEQGPLAVYRLEPDGTQFSDAVEFSITVDADGSGTFPFATLVSGENIESVENLVVEEREDGSFTLSGEVGHFSNISILGGFFALDMPQDLGTYTVGETFTAPAIIIRRSSYVSRSFPPSGEKVDVHYALSGTPSLRLGYYFAKYPIDPKVISDVPSKAMMTADTFFVEGKFTCTTDISYRGDQIEYSVMVDYDYTWFSLRSETGERSNVFSTGGEPGLTLRKFTGVRCIYPPGEEPPKTEDGTFIIPSGSTFGSPPLILLENTDDDDVIPVDDTLPESVEEEEVVEAPASEEENVDTTATSSSCTEPWVYGYPVTDPSNLPDGCRPTNDTPGWDCYTFEDASCSPTTRCFCLAPAENL